MFMLDFFDAPAELALSNPFLKEADMKRIPN